MGATESIFYDEEPPVPSTTVSAGGHQIQASHQRKIKSYPPSPPTQKNRERPNVAATDSKQHQDQQKSNRRLRKVQQNQHIPPIKRIDGWILGGPKTGKWTLLQRLEGRDPFASKNKDDRINVGLSTTSITIPYRPPPESPSWDRIQLHITAPSSKSRVTLLDSHKPNFVVMMVNPRDEVETTQINLESALLSYIGRLGYDEGIDRDDRGDSGSMNDQKCSTTLDASSTALRKCNEPVCIAILLNFRDLQDEIGIGARVHHEWHDRIQGILESKNVPTNKTVLDVIDTSLLNCYGLDGLHHFIYRTYLQRRSADLEEELQEARYQLELTNSQRRSIAEQPSYEDFLKLFARQIKDPKEGSQRDQTATSEPTEEEEGGTKRIEPSVDKSMSSEQRKLPQKEPTQRGAARRELNLESRLPQKQEPRRQSRRHQTSSTSFGKEALEAFLASSSDEEGIAANSRINPSTKRWYKHSTMSDDEDDDFFYDESGRQQFNHLTGQNGDSADDTSSSDDEEEVKVERLAASSVNGHFINKVGGPLASQTKVVQDLEDSTPHKTQANPQKGNEIMENEAESTDAEGRSSNSQQSTQDRTKDERDASRLDSSNVVQEKSLSISMNETNPETSTAAEVRCFEEMDKPQVRKLKTCEEKGMSSANQGNDENPSASGAVDADERNCDVDSNAGADDVDDDEYMIGSTAPLESDDESDDDYMIGTIPTEDLEDSQEDDDYMIGSAPQNANDSGNDQSINATIVEGKDDNISEQIKNSTPSEGNDDGDSYSDRAIAEAEAEPEHLHEEHCNSDLVDRSPVIQNASEDEARNLKGEHDESDQSTNEVSNHSLETHLAAKHNEVDKSNHVSDLPIVEVAEDDIKTEPNHPAEKDTNAYSTRKVAPSKETFASQTWTDEATSSSGDTHPSPQLATYPSRGGRNSDAHPPISALAQPTTVAATPGLSAAALAAIAAAQQEAEAMLRQQQQSITGSAPRKSEKKSKKKKDDEKKKKRKKKDKSLDV